MKVKKAAAFITRKAQDNRMNSSLTSYESVLLFSLCDENEMCLLSFTNQTYLTTYGEP